MEATGTLMFMMMSGYAMVVGGLTDAALWPVSQLVCPPDKKMTLDSGCEDRAIAYAPGTVGNNLASLCCVLSAIAAWWVAGPLASLLFCVACSVLSLAAGSWATTPQRVRVAA